jgi:hypothetical protein
MMHLQQSFDDDARATEQKIKVRVINSVIRKRTEHGISVQGAWVLI